MSIMGASASHTRGPWSVRLAKGSYKRPAFVEAEGGKIVASCLGNQLEPDATSIREAEANACLIAAAPELLEACIWAEAALAPFSKEPAEKSGITKLRAAIAKAHGENPNG